MNFLMNGCEFRNSGELSARKREFVGILVRKFSGTKPFLSILCQIIAPQKQYEVNKNLALIIFLKFIPRASETGLRRMLEKISERNF